MKVLLLVVSVLFLGCEQTSELDTQYNTGSSIAASSENTPNNTASDSVDMTVSDNNGSDNATASSLSAAAIADFVATSVFTGPDTVANSDPMVNADSVVNADPMVNADSVVNADYSVPNFSGLSGELLSASTEPKAFTMENKTVTENQTVPIDNQNLYCRFTKSFFRGDELRTSKWDTIGLIQQKLQLEVDGFFGQKTQTALNNFRTKNNLPANDCIDVTVHQKILPQQKVPDYQARACALTFLMEGTDYDKIEYNYGTSDSSAMTWGPMGMTLKSGEIQSILRAVIARDTNCLKTFAGEGSNVFLTALAKMGGDEAANYVRHNYWNLKGKQRQFVLDAFKKIAESAVVREEFDKVAQRTVDMRFRHYRNFLKTQSNVTEIDWAMFWDIAVQTGYSEKYAQALAAIDTKGKSSNERRKVWGDYIVAQVSKAWQNDRRRRNETFYANPDVMKAYGLGERRIIF